MSGKALEQAIEKLNKQQHSDRIPSGSTRQVVSFLIRFFIDFFVDRGFFCLRNSSVESKIVIGIFSILVMPLVFF